MTEVERDSTGEWLLPEARRPPTVAELERRVDHALAVARSAEAAALEIGEAALDAAEQARRAAELAERASARTLPGPARAGNGDRTPPPDERLQVFIDRADRVMSRLRALDPLPERVG